MSVKEDWEEDCRRDDVKEDINNRNGLEWVEIFREESYGMTGLAGGQT